MPANRYKDWLRQAEHDLETARANAKAGAYDWACFIAQQAAVKPLKALILYHSGQPWGALAPCARRAASRRRATAR